MKYLDIEALGLDFKNVVSAPAPIGRIFNYLRKIGKGELFDSGQRTTTGGADGNIADKWCVNYMVGLGIIKISAGGDNGKHLLLLTENGQRIFDVLPDSDVNYSEASEVSDVISELGDNYERVREVFESVFRESMPFKNLSIYLRDTKYWFKKTDFYKDYYDDLCEGYNINNTASKQMEENGRQTGDNRITSLAQSCFFIKYALPGRIDRSEGIFFLREKFDYEPDLDDKTVNRIIDFPHNRIVFGAPGTGKSFRLNKQSKKFDYFERVTFHPNYSYSQFVGSYKPITVKKNQDGDTKSDIEYSFVPGPFLRVYKKAVFNPSKNYLLLIEEINRANVASVFGEVFQLLDRNDNNQSRYPVTTSEDVRNYLAEFFYNKPYQALTITDEREKCEELNLPSNMYIWTTMNSADQGVYPIDTAFKRRWEFEYIGIDEEADETLKSYEIPIPYENNDNNNSNEEKVTKYYLVKWDELRKAINAKLTQNCNVNEDKLLGPYFLSETRLKTAKTDKKSFVNAFKSKVIMYLFEDAVKMQPKLIFSGINQDNLRYSDVCNEFDKQGVGIFGINEEEIRIKYDGSLMDSKSENNQV